MGKNLIALAVGVLFIVCGFIALGQFGWFYVSIICFGAGCVIVPLSAGDIRDTRRDAKEADRIKQYRDEKWLKDLNQ